MKRKIADLLWFVGMPLFAGAVIGMFLVTLMCDARALPTTTASELSTRQRQVARLLSYVLERVEEEEAR